MLISGLPATPYTVKYLKTQIFNLYKLENNSHIFSAFNFELAYGEIGFKESLSLEKYPLEISP